MDPPSIAVSAVEAVLIFAGLGIRFLARKRWLDAADPGHVVDGGANLQLQATDGESGPSANVELVVRGRNSQNLSFPSSISAPCGYVFEVFLSFRGADIRKTFADFLYHYLINFGVHTFIDSEELRVGKQIGPGLMRAIKQSKIFLPIFTRGYASSKWCLREVAEAVKWMKEDVSSSKQGTIIMPIFFDVTPDEVQHQTGSYAQAFAQHEKKFDPKTIRGWRDALKEVTKLKGLELSEAANGYQGKFIKMLVIGEILRELRRARVDVSEILVGLNDPAREVMQMLAVDLNGIRMVGIWGIGGTGKTTLAKYVYNQIADRFDCCSILSDVGHISRKPGGLLELQRKLVSDILWSQNDDANNDLKSRLSGKKALVLIDGVDGINQLKALAAEPGWFGSGSRIIVTTREKGVLNQGPWSSAYELKPLDEDLALELFRKYAFRDDLPSTEFVDLSRDIVRIIGGLPLALTVTGSYLYASRGKKDVWEDTIALLEKIPHMDVQEKRRISYDALAHKQKQIFLDFVCFSCWDYKFVVTIWHACGFYPTRGKEVLQLRSLIKIGDDNKLQMHHLLRDLGRHIVEGPKELKLQSRLWQIEEALDVLSGPQDTLDYPDEYLTSTSGYLREEHGELVQQSLSFHSNEEVRGPFGEETGIPFSSPSTGGKIVGFHGSCNLHPLSTGAYMETVSHVHLVRSVGPFGGYGGTPWDDGKHTDLRKIVIRSGAVIDSIRCVYDANGAYVEQLRHGGRGGHNGYTVELDYPNEYITTISGYYGQRRARTVIKSLTFQSNRRVHGPYGKEEGTYFQSPPNVGKLVGFYGRSGKYLDSIGAFFAPVLHKDPTKTAGPYGGQGGNPWDDGKHTDLRMIFISYGTIIDGIRCEYDESGESVSAEMHGGRGGNSYTIELDYPNEYLMSVAGYIGTFRDAVVIRSLMFESNKRKFGPFGTRGEKPFSFTSSIGKIVGFSGRSDRYLNSIAAHLQIFPDHSL